MNIQNWISCLLFGIPTLLMAQAPVRLEGRILDEESQAPLGYAYIHVGPLGTLSNDQGVFVLRLPEAVEQDSLEITFLGYASRKIPWRDLVGTKRDIQLEPAPLTLDEVEIRPMEPRDTLRKVWRNRRHTLAVQPIRLRGYYREHTRAPGLQTEFFYGEGVLEVYKPGFPIRTPDQVRIIKSRSKPRKAGIMRGEQFIPVPLVTQGPHLGTELDILRIHDSFLKPSALRAYELAVVRITRLYGRFTYVFSFTPRDPDDVYAQFEGLLFIDSESLALVRAEYQLTDYGVELISRTQTGIDLASRTYTVNYRKTKNYWVLQDARVENNYRFRFPDMEEPLQSRMTFVVTDIEDEGVRSFPAGQRMELNRAFATVAETIPPDFWAEFNIIVPEDSLLQQD